MFVYTIRTHVKDFEVKSNVELNTFDVIVIEDEKYFIKQKFDNEFWGTPVGNTVSVFQ